MEENKEIKQEKLSYEDLNNVCHQLSEQCRRMQEQLQQANLTNAFRRLDYLFAILENSKSFPDDFVKKCVNEIMEMMTISEVNNKEEE